ncbi:MAG: intracellular protease, PfpI family [Gammaproteobacteria bacterium]|nr:intracellular protease, PfpI family [Gammaproteobacteria bacterium]
MKGNGELRQRRVAVLAADGFEMVELVVPLLALRKARAQVDVISLRHGRIRGVNLHEPARRVRVTKTVAEADVNDYDALLIPGGFINPDLLRQSAAARAFVQAFDAAGKPIATLCHGPWVLASAGLTQGRTMTSWPGIRDDLVNAGATWLDQEVVRDGNWVTSRGPQDLRAFVPAMLDLFSGSAPEPSVARPSQSAPQRDDPPNLVLAAMRWLPRPSIRTAATAALVGLWAVRRARSKFQSTRAP